MFKEFYNEVKDKIVENYEDGYPFDAIHNFNVRVWNVDILANSKITITKNATKHQPMFNITRKFHATANLNRNINTPRIPYLLPSLLTLSLSR